MSSKKIIWHVPNEWKPVLTELLEVLTSNPNVSAKRYMVEHKENLAQIDEMVSRQVIRRDHVKDTFQLHSMGLLITESELSKSILSDMEVVFTILLESYDKNLDAPIIVSELVNDIELNTQRTLAALNYMVDLVVFGHSLPFPEIDSTIHPHEGILNVKSITSQLEAYAPIWFPIDKMSTQGIAQPVKNSGNAKSIRKKKLKDFIYEINTRAEAEGHLWRSNSIPVKGEDFTNLFFELYGDEVKKISTATLMDDARELGVKFDQGTSKRPGEVLRELFFVDD